MMMTFVVAENTRAYHPLRRARESVDSSSNEDGRQQKNIEGNEKKAVAVFDEASFTQPQRQRPMVTQHLAVVDVGLCLSSSPCLTSRDTNPQVTGPFTFYFEHISCNKDTQAKAKPHKSPDQAPPGTTTRDIPTTTMGKKSKSKSRRLRATPSLTCITAGITESIGK